MKITSVYKRMHIAQLILWLGMLPFVCYAGKTVQTGVVTDDIKQEIEAAAAAEKAAGIQQVESTEPDAGSNEADTETVDTTGSEADEAVVDSGSEEIVAEQPQLTFNIWEYRVEGNNLLDRQLIERTVYPYLGPDKTIDTVETARAALETIYRDKGFGTVLVDIPEQDVVNGVVQLKVTEGALERVRITGARYYSLGKIREQLPSLKEGTTPNLPKVQEELAALNASSAGRVVTPVLKPGKTPGKLEVELKVKDEFPLHGSVEINDRFISNTSRLRLNANLRYDNLWQLNHSASLGYVVAPLDRNEVEVFFGTYLMRFADSRNLLALYAVDASSDIAATGDISQVGVGNIYGARAIFPLPGLQDFNHNLTLGADYKDFQETTQLLGVDAQNTPIDYVSFVTTYRGNWIHETAKTALTAEARIAPRGFGNTTKEFTQKRFGAKPNFAFLKLRLQHDRQFLLDTLLKIDLQSQISDSPIISNEQFTVGGIGSVRGYLEAQQLADDGLVGSLEIQTPSLAKHIGDFLSDLHFLTFIEGARLRIQEPLPGQIKRFTLASSGLGFRVSALDGMNAELLWAVAFNENGDINAGDSRIHFKLGYEF